MYHNCFFIAARQVSTIMFYCLGLNSTVNWYPKGLLTQVCCGIVDNH
jgi:hypothetical protein